LPNPPLTDLHDSFRIFQQQECAAWKKDISPAHLVRPSGSLNAPLAHHLNQPSFTTIQSENGETADQTNGCIAMVMGNVYNTETLLFDHVHRREATSEAIKQYPSEILAHHENFTRSIMESMRAKAEVVWGLKVQQRLIETYRFEVLPLWGDFEGVVALLSYESNYRNADSRFTFRRLILLPCHPQAMFYQRPHSTTAIRQDKIMLAAARMVHSRVPWVLDYYSEKKWYACVPNRLRQLAHIQHRLSDLTILYEDETAMKESIPTGSWHDILFLKQPYSNQELRQLIPPALAVLKSDCSLNSWRVPSDLPKPVFEWLQGQKQILFADVAISSFTDIVQTLMRILQMPQRGNSEQLLPDLLQAMLLHQQKILDGLLKKIKMFGIVVSMVR
jgi:hypothetical protein